MTNDEIMQATGCPDCGQPIRQWCGPMDPLEGRIAPRVGFVHPARVEVFAYFQSGQLSGASHEASDALIGKVAEDKLF